MMEERKEFEEYKMKLIAFQGDIITTSNVHGSDTDIEGEYTGGSSDDSGSFGGPEF